MKKSAKESYTEAYHRLRTFQSLELVWEADTYPTGYDCEGYQECNTSHPDCMCFREEVERHTAHRETLKEAQSLLNSPINPYYIRLAAKAYADRMEYLDFLGREIEPCPNYQLNQKLLAARVRNRGLR